MSRFSIWYSPRANRINARVSDGEYFVWVLVSAYSSFEINVRLASVIIVLSIVVIHRFNLLHSLFRTSSFVKHVSHNLLGIISLILGSESKISTEGSSHMKLSFAWLSQIAELQNATIWHCARLADSNRKHNSIVTFKTLSFFHIFRFCRYESSKSFEYFRVLIKHFYIRMVLRINDFLESFIIILGIRKNHATEDKH